MINYIIDLLGCMSPMWDYALTDLMALAFVATVPCLIREVVRLNV